MKLKQRGLALILALILLLPLPAVALSEEEGSALAPGVGEEGVYTDLYRGMLAAEERIDIERYNLTVDEAHEVFSRVYYSEAELFFMTGRYSYGYAEVEGERRVTSIMPVYSVTAGEAAAMLEEFYRITDAILRSAPALATDLAKAAYVHDYIALHYAYDDALQNYDVYSMLTEGTGVCQAYSLLARYLLRRLGIPTECVTSDELVHEWNAVMLDGSWYHMDITWDDRDDGGFLGQVDHTFFLSSDAFFQEGPEGVTRTHAASDWWSPVVCSDTRYDGVYLDVTSAFAELDGRLYAIMDGALCALDAPLASPTRLYEFDVWHTYPSTIRYWEGTYAGLWVLDGRLIFNTESNVCCYDPSTARVSVLTSHRGAGGYVYGMSLDGDSNVTLALMTTPNDQSYTPLRFRLAFKVTWVIGAESYEETYFYGETPACKVSTEIPTDHVRYTFSHWDKLLSPVRADTVYTAVYTGEQLYALPASALLLPLERAVSAEGCAARWEAIGAALAARDRVNPDYPGVAEARAALEDLIEDYDSEARRTVSVMEGLLLIGGS